MTNVEIINSGSASLKDTYVRFSVGSKKYEFDSKIEFADAFIFFDYEKVIVLQSGWSNTSRFVGAVFDFKGTEIFSIPFPSLSAEHAQVKCSYSWASLNDSDIKMVFGTDSILVGDFWIDFNVISLSYGLSGRSR